MHLVGFTVEVKFIFYTYILISWTIIKLDDLGWAGHGIGKADEMISKKVLKGKFRNRRPVGKTRTRCKDVVTRDTAHILGIRGWGRRAEGREEWMRLLGEARVKKGAAAS